MELRRSGSREGFVFPCGEWLGKGEEEGGLIRELPATGPAIPKPAPGSPARPLPRTPSQPLRSTPAQSCPTRSASRRGVGGERGRMRTSSAAYSAPKVV